MAITWERLSGDTSKFALRMSFSADPDAGAGATPEESASWGAFQLWVRGRNLCAHYVAGETSASVHWYLLPFLEWWTSNWDPLFHEERLPNEIRCAHAIGSLHRTSIAPLALNASGELRWDEAWFSWWGRHCIVESRFGGAFPPVCFRRWRDSVEVSWDAANSPPGTEVQFLESNGAERLAPLDVAGPVYTVLTDAASHLRSRYPTSGRISRLAENLERIRGGRPERLAWLLGFGRSAPERTQAVKQIANALDQFPRRVQEAILKPRATSDLFLTAHPAALMFGATSPDLSVSDRVRLVRHLAEARASRIEKRGVDEISSSEPVSIERPWEQGYELAEQTLVRLNVEEGDHGPVDIDAILDSLGVETKTFKLDDASVRAVAIGGLGYQPTVLLNTRNETNRSDAGRRFSLAHELCHLIFDRDRARDVVVPSGPWAPLDIEQRANAFAAMLLMPTERVRHVAANLTHRSPGQLVSDVSSRLNTSWTATLEHLTNIGLLTEQDRESVLDAAASNIGSPFGRARVAARRRRSRRAARKK